MRFRTKLLILFLIIAISPILFMRINGQKVWKNFFADVVPQARRAMVRQHQERLRSVVENYAATTSMGAETLELITYLQREAAQRALARATGGVGGYLMAKDCSQGFPKDVPVVQAPDFYKVLSGGGIEPLDVSFDRFLFKLAPDANPDQAAVQMGKINSQLTLFKNLRPWLKSLVLWQYVSLENGIHVSYPAYHHVPRGYDPRKQYWYQMVKAHREMKWSSAFVDPVTRQHCLAVAAPINGPDGEFLGVTALIMPNSAVLARGELVRNLPPSTDVIMASLEDFGKSGRAFIVATQGPDSGRSRNWRKPMAPQWLTSRDTEFFEAMISDIKAGMTNFRRMDFKGRDCLWVYGPVNGPTFLAMITPYEDVMSEWRNIEEFMGRQSAELIWGLTYLLFGVAILVIILALVFSRTVTRPIQALAEGGKRLRRGDFNAKVVIKSKDELGELGEVFNSIGPRLKDYYNMRQSMALAMEVQQNLLPNQGPEVPGLDIAGKSVYCDETGGDYYDFMDIHGLGEDGVGVVVADVSGHGIPAALLMASARAFLRQRSSMPGRIARKVSDVNKQLVLDVFETGRFITMFFCEIDTTSNEVRWVRAGHDPALVYDPAVDEFSELNGAGLPLGVMPDTVYDENERPISSGQVIVIGTDGIWEARKPDGEMFGKERLKEIIRRMAGQSAKEIIAETINVMNDFRQGLEQEDDVTLVIVKVL